MAAQGQAESERVARRLREEILDGFRAPGSKLVERELAHDLGVSRVPVREALKILAAEGLVTLRPRTWAVVREFSAAELDEFGEVRSALELLTFTLAAQRWEEDGLAHLKATLDAEFAAARAGDAVGARRAAGDFHQVVTQLAGNQLLSELEETLRSRMRWLLAQHDDLLAVAAEHAELYRAVADRDETRVADLVRVHLAASRRHQQARAQ